jgi:hypothetical protein
VTSRESDNHLRQAIASRRGIQGILWQAFMVYDASSALG